MTTPTNEEVRRQFEAEVERVAKAMFDGEQASRNGGWQWSECSPLEVEGWKDLARIAIPTALSSPAVAGLVEALREAQWDCHGKCPVCAGFMVGPCGETRHAHTPECPVGTALAQYATLAGESHG